MLGLTASLLCECFFGVDILPPRNPPLSLWGFSVGGSSVSDSERYLSFFVCFSGFFEEPLSLGLIGLIGLIGLLTNTESLLLALHDLRPALSHAW